MLRPTRLVCFTSSNLLEWLILRLLPPSQTATLSRQRHQPPTQAEQASSSRLIPVAHVVRAADPIVHTDTWFGRYQVLPNSYGTVSDFATTRPFQTGTGNTSCVAVWVDCTHTYAHTKNGVVLYDAIEFVQDAEARPLAMTLSDI
jgi:hypothetical protein